MNPLPSSEGFPNSSFAASWVHTISYCRLDEYHVLYLDVSEEKKLF